MGQNWELLQFWWHFSNVKSRKKSCVKVYNLPEWESSHVTSSQGQRICFILNCPSFLFRGCLSSFVLTLSTLQSLCQYSYGSTAVLVKPLEETVYVKGRSRSVLYCQPSMCQHGGVHNKGLQAKIDELQCLIFFHVSSWQNNSGRTLYCDPACVTSVLVFPTICY